MDPIRIFAWLETTEDAAVVLIVERLAADLGLRARQGAAGRVRALALYDEARVVARQITLLGL